MTTEPRSFHNPAPVVSYEVDASDILIRVNEAWLSFAVANDAPDLMTDHVIGRSLWEFMADDTTRLVYEFLLKEVRAGGRSRFPYRCDSPHRRRFMEMTITGASDGHVIFESATVRVERHPQGRHAALDTANLEPTCGWCTRPRGERDWYQLGPAVASVSHVDTSRMPVIAEGMCADCYSCVMNSVDDDPRTVAAVVGQAALKPLHLSQPASQAVRASTLRNEPRQARIVPVRRAS